MKRFYTLIFTLFFILLAKSAFAQTKAHASCGVNKKCADGYYCAGANADSESGVCVANALNVTMCRFVEYVQKDIFSYIAIFASVFLGLYMFVGKVSPGMVAQIVLGLGVLYGSQELLNKVLGSSKGVCSIKEANSCLEKVVNAPESPSYAIYQNIRNTVKQKDIFDKECGLLDCVLSSCPKYQKVQVNKPDNTIDNECSIVGNAKNRENKFIRLNRSTTSLSSITLKPYPNECPSFEITCEPVQSISTKNYFICENTCTKVKYAAKVDHSLGIKNCKDLSTKNITQKQP